MRHQLLSAALTAAIALTAYAHTTTADPNRSGDGGHAGGDWIINGPSLTGSAVPGTTSLKVADVISIKGV